MPVDARLPESHQCQKNALEIPWHLILQTKFFTKPWPLFDSPKRILSPPIKRSTAFPRSHTPKSKRHTGAAYQMATLHTSRRNCEPAIPRLRRSTVVETFGGHMWTGRSFTICTYSTVYVCMYIYLHICMLKCKFICTYIYTHTHMYIHICIYICLSIYLSIHHPIYLSSIYIHRYLYTTFWPNIWKYTNRPGSSSEIVISRHPSMKRQVCHESKPTQAHYHEREGLHSDASHHASSSYSHTSHCCDAIELQVVR